MTAVHVFETNSWLHEQITTGQTTDHVIVSDPNEADTLIYPIPGWSEGPGVGRLSRISPRWWRRLFVYSTDDRPLMWAPGVYASAPSGRATGGPFRGGHYLVHHNIEEGGLTIASSDPSVADHLWTFVGTAATFPKLRTRVIALDDPRSIRADTTEWHTKTRWEWKESGNAGELDAFRDYSEALRRSLFVACPRGAGPSSMRIFEAMEAGRCPVIISDEWLAPPMVNWDECSIRVAEHEVDSLPERLRAEEHRARELGQHARREWERWFARERMLDFLVAAISDIRATSSCGTSARAVALARSAATREALHRAKKRSLGR